MSITDTFHINYSLPTVVDSVSGAPAGSWIAYNLIEKIKDTLLLAGWTITGTTAAQGPVYILGWGVSYSPTRFREIFKDGSLASDYVTVNDQCGCAESANPNPGGGGDISFGIPQAVCGRLCSNGCWRGRTCPCGHTCCSESACVIHLDTTSPGCDGSGDYCNGEFTGDFIQLCLSIAGPSNYYRSSPYDPNGHNDGAHVWIYAKQGGPEWNAPNIVTGFGVGFSNGPALSVSGGGYIIKSRPNPFNGTRYSIKITQNGDGQVSLVFIDAFGNSEEYLLACVDNFIGGTPAPYYKIIANAYQLIILDTNNAIDIGPSFGFGGNSILATSGWTDNPALFYHVIVIGPGQLKNRLVYQEGKFSTSFINGNKYTTLGDSLHLFGFTARNYSFPDSLYTSDGDQIKSNAWFFAPAGPGEESTIICKLWSGFVSSKIYPRDTVIPFDANTSFHQIALQDGSEFNQVCSLWVAEVNLLGGTDFVGDGGTPFGSKPKKQIYLS